MSAQNSRVPLIYSDEAGQLQEVPVGDQIVVPDMGIRVGVLTATVFSNNNNITGALQLGTTGVNYFHVGAVTVGTGATITVGAGVTYRVV